MRFKKHKTWLIQFFVLALMNTFAFGATKAEIGSNPKISINVDNATLDNIFSILEKKTTFHFNYGGDIMSDSRKFSLTYSSADLGAILKDIAGKAEVRYSITGKTVLIKKSKPSLGQQQKTIKGKVTDINGTPMPGASILEKGTSKGVATNFDGDFSIEVSGLNPVLVVSYMGYVTQEVSD